MADIHVKAKVRIPTPPTFLTLEMPGQAERQDGFQELPKIDVADLTDDALREVGAAWTTDLIANAKYRREQRHAR